MAKWLSELFNEYMEEELGEDVKSSPNATVVIGGIYFGSLASIDTNKSNKPLYFLVVDQVDDNLYEVLKVSDHYEFATNIDIILDIGTMKVIIETDNNFYLADEEINKFILIHKIPEQDIKDILLFRDGEEPSRPLQVGVTPIFEEDIRNQFHIAEFRMIEDLHLRVFAILQDPEELEEEPLEEE